MRTVILCGVILMALAANAWGHHDIFGPVTSGDVERVRYVLSQEPELVSVKSKAGLTPLHVAVMGGHLAVVLVLIDSNADVRGLDSNGNTPLHLAAASGTPDMVRALLDAGADRKAVNYAGKTPLDISVEKGREEIDVLLRGEE
ncbi:MAG: ankyrin repeat domain-containing protein [bacterium]|nr:MAG: ankyrin repeat domain-containing protein [bacterium]